jgi:hypothetical protein
MAMVSGDGLRRPLNAPPGVTPSSGVQPGVDTGVEYARIVIVFGPAGSVSGVFVYPAGTTPGAGNPAVEAISNASKDPYGNTIQPGIMSQIPGGAFVSLFQGEINFSGGATIEGVSGNGNLLFTTGGEYGFLGGPVVSTAGTAASPSVISTDTWHGMGLLNGWANAAGNVTAQYRLVASPPNSVEVIGALAANAATAATFFTLPAGYRPASQQQVACGATGGQVAGSTPFAQCDAGGNLTVQHDTIGAADAYLFHGFISLDA